eukprot:TRINITY_DN110215_c0_g1_i1.p1 TRINITY_DN110215_c0_g1~~TRINITY_DN110215_c0_g1_i1.p1  ORF type:complete len:761 (-),score=149.48 TRINITY_DN110215_c0_g1_i1:20-2302(-)
MGDAGDFRSREQLVQQVLEERRQRLHQKLAEATDRSEEGYLAQRLDLDCDSPLGRNRTPCRRDTSPAWTRERGLGETSSEILFNDVVSQSQDFQVVTNSASGGLEIIHDPSWSASLSARQPSSCRSLDFHGCYVDGEEQEAGRRISARGSLTHSDDALCTSCGNIIGSKFCRCRKRESAMARQMSEGSSASMNTGRGRTKHGSHSARAPSRQRPKSAPQVRRSLGNSDAWTPRNIKLRKGFCAKLNEWSLQQEATKQKRQKSREEKELRESQQCTFQPAINSKSDFYARRSRGCFIVPLQERLFHEADQRSTLRSKAKEFLDADDMYECTFQPKINKNHSGTANHSDSTPLHLRTDAIRQMKEDRTNAIQEQRMRAECVFKPQISERSKRIVERKRREQLQIQSGTPRSPDVNNPGERLYADAQRKEQCRASNQAFSESRQSSETSQACNRSSLNCHSVQQDFLARQRSFELSRRQRMEIRMQLAEDECPFRPTITEASHHLVSCNPELIGETADERVERLAVKDVDRRERARRELEQKHRDCTFKPEVNSVSEASAFGGNAMSCDSSVHERLYRTAIAKSKPSNKMEEHSFRPHLNAEHPKRFAHVKSHYSSRADMMDSIRQEQDRRRAELALKRQRLEEEELANCTFHPELRQAYEPDTEVIVSGLSRFFELKSMAQRKQQEQKERERQVFRASASEAARVGVTIPEPFELSTGPAGSRTSQLLSCHGSWSQGVRAHEWSQRCDETPSWQASGWSRVA